MSKHAKNSHCHHLNTVDEVRKKIIATDDTIKEIVHQEIRKYGLNADLNHIDTSQVTDFSYLFSNTNFNGNISQWNTSHAKNMSYMFYLSSFNGDINQWDVSNVKMMNFMFAYSKFDNNISQWNVSNVEAMARMFSGSKFNGNISNWNTSNVKYMHAMFYNSKFNGNISQWDVSNVIDMSTMFANSKFNSDISCWNTENVKDMAYMFLKSNFNQNISQWNVSNVQDFFAMFRDSKFNQDISSWHLKDDVKLNFMFNLQYFNHFSNFLHFFNEKRNKNYLSNFFSFSKNFNPLKDKDQLLQFIHFVENNKLMDFDFPFFYYGNVPYPFLLCQCFNKNNSEIFQKFSQSHFDFAKEDNNITKQLQNFKTMSNIFCNNSSNEDRNNLDEEKENNLDFILNHLLNYSSSDIDVLVFEPLFLEDIFGIDVEHLFSSLNDLLKALDKDIKDVSLVDYLLNIIFHIEKKLIKNNEEYYLSILKTNNLKFSNYFPYYSFSQKRELINLKNSTTTNLDNNILL